MLLSRKPWMDVNTTHLTGTAGGQRERRGVWRMTPPTLPNSCRTWRLLLTGPPRPPLAEAVTNGKLWETRFSVFDMYLCSPASKSTPQPVQEDRGLVSTTIQPERKPSCTAKRPRSKQPAPTVDASDPLCEARAWSRWAGTDVRGNTDGKPPAGSRPGPSNCSTVVQKAAVDWC